MKLWLSKKIIPLITGVSLLIFLWPVFVSEDETDFSAISPKVEGIKSELAEEVVIKPEEKNWTFPEAPIKGAVIPHDYLTQQDFLNDFFSFLKKQSPRVIIFLAPNHQELGTGDIITASHPLSSIFGEVKINQAIITSLVDEGIKAEDFVFNQEHAIYGLTPYFKENLPDTEIVPLLFKRGTRLQRIEEIKKIIGWYLAEDVILVAAIDFSHYLTWSEASENDKYTEEGLLSFDALRFFSLGSNFNDYVDSPPAIAFFLLVMKERASQAEIVYHDNTGLSSGQLNAPSTSFFGAVYY